MTLVVAAAGKEATHLFVATFTLRFTTVCDSGSGRVTRRVIPSSH